MIKYKNNEFYFSYNLAECDYNEHTTSIDSNNYYGRETIITGGKIVSVRYDSIYDSIKGDNKIESVKDYCLERYIRKVITSDVLTAEVKAGYYGDEPAGAHLNEDIKEKMISFIDSLNDSSVNETSLVEAVLLEEYGFLLEDIKNKRWFYDVIATKDIIAGSVMRHTSKQLIEQYMKDIDVIACVCQQNGKKYRLIDGYHRFSAANRLNKEKIIGIYCQ